MSENKGSIVPWQQFSPRPTNFMFKTMELLSDIHTYSLHPQSYLYSRPHRPLIDRADIKQYNFSGIWYTMVISTLFKQRILVILQAKKQTSSLKYSELL